MSSRLFAAVGCVSFAIACAPSHPVAFDVSRLGPSTGASGAGLATTGRGLGSGRSDQYYTPTSFVMTVCSIAISDDGAASGPGGSGHELLFDAVNDSECVPLDLAAGDRLTDLVDTTVATTVSPVGWIGVAYLPTITFAYADGRTGSVTYTPPQGCPSSNYWAEIGPCRNRMAFDLNLYEPENGWEDTSMPVNGPTTLTLYLDLEASIYEDNGVPGIRDDFFYFTAMPGMRYAKYRFQRSTYADHAVTDFPHQAFVLFAANGLPVYGNVRTRNFHGGAFPDAAALPFDLQLVSAQHPARREEVFAAHPDGSFDLLLDGGRTLSNLGAAAHMGSMVGATDCDYFASYEEGLFTDTGVMVTLDDTP